jgi:hypothetical protein
MRCANTKKPYLKLAASLSQVWGAPTLKTIPKTCCHTFTIGMRCANYRKPVPNACCLTFNVSKGWPRMRPQQPPTQPDTKSHIFLCYNANLIIAFQETFRYPMVSFKVAVSMCKSNFYMIFIQKKKKSASFA